MSESLLEIPITGKYSYLQGALIHRISDSPILTMLRIKTTSHWIGYVQYYGVSSDNVPFYRPVLRVGNKLYYHVKLTITISIIVR